MLNEVVMPELREVVGALIFGSGRPLSVAEIRRCLQEVAKDTVAGEEPVLFADVKDEDVAAAVEALVKDLDQARAGFVLREVSGGYRLESLVSCGPWLRHLLKIGKPNRLSRPALETLSIVAYRQPIARSEIEAVRGVNVDRVMRVLLEMQLVRIVGRSELPGRPLLYGTTQMFLDHFGLKSLKDLSEMETAILNERRVAPISTPEESAEDEQPAGGEASPANPPAQDDAPAGENGVGE
jgi:segregation and condensation protein B